MKSVFEQKKTKSRNEKHFVENWKIKEIRQHILKMQ